MDDIKGRVNELADLIDEFRLTQAELSGEGWRIALRKRAATKQIVVGAETAAEDVIEADEEAQTAQAPDAPKGFPVSSPMTGIYYSSPSPSAPSFVKEGEPVTAGQVVGLIEAMKVFNEITAPSSGTVTKMLATNGQLVQPGDALLYIG